MKEKFNWDGLRVVRLTRFATIVVGAVFVISATAVGGIVFFSNSQAKDAEAEAKQLHQKAAEIGRVLEDARSKAEISVRNQSKAVADFQENVSTLARDCGIEVAEFVASTDFQPYLTRFAKKTEGGGWSQVEIQLTFGGETRKVIDAIGKLARQSVPIEFNSIQVMREKIGPEGSTVKAKLQLRVLVKTPGGGV